MRLIADWTCEQKAVDIAPGDRLVVFSDGVTEARNAREEEFGEARLVEAVLREGPRPLALLPAAILAAVEGFTGTPQADDVTLLVARGR
jgi:sigma-B regulation protein RsbU (phosphoserine phosphatase)